MSIPASACHSFQTADLAASRESIRRSAPPQSNGEGSMDLPNRARLDWYLGHLLSFKPEPPFNSALLVIELSEVRAMRYAFGDHICNRFLHIAGQRFLGEAVRGQFLSALNDGEFAFVISKCTGREECIAVAKRLLACISESIQIDGQDYFSTALIGIAFAGDEAETPADMLHRAQAVLHEARPSGSSPIRFADGNSAKLASEELSMLNEVHSACLRGEFYLHYQPIVELSTREIRGLEALLRWKSPKFGEVPPQRFIPLLEQYGGILDVGDWVLRAACRQARIWNLASARPLRISVNVSAIQLETGDFETRLVNILAETRCRPTWIELEITESTAVRAMSDVKDRLAAIASRGITIAIDDFGTGYSSFGHLANMPVHHLKLDRSLMANLPQDRKGVAIVRAIQMLSRTLGLTLTVEGIERQDQRLFCEQAGIEQGQGFFLGMPASSFEVEATLNRTRRDSAIAA